MRRTKQQRFTIWLCLVYAFFVGVAPAQGMVLCLEPGGTIALEPATSEFECAGCPSLTADPKADSKALSGHSEDCPCIDVLISRPDNEPVLAKITTMYVATPTLQPPAPLSTWLPYSLVKTSEPLNAALPRSPHLHPFIRSIVLHV